MTLMGRKPGPKAKRLKIKQPPEEALRRLLRERGEDRQKEEAERKPAGGG